MAITVNRDLVRRLRAPAYAFLLVTVVFQVFDYVAGLLPLQFNSVVWRFAALGAATNIVGNILLLVLLVYALSLMAGDRPVILFVGIVSVLIAVLLLGGAGIFALDALQLRTRAEPRALPKFDLASGQALVKMLVEGIVALLFAVSAFRALIAASRDALRDDRSSETPIVARSPAFRAP